MVTIADFRQALIEAEEEIKFAELSVGSLASVESDGCIVACEPRGIVIPAINELRYAAKHISDAMQEGVSAEDRAEQIHRAIRHCIRARLDALKAVVLFLARDFYQFCADYRKLNITVKDREKLNAHRQKIWDVLSALSKDRSQSTNENCEKLKASIVELHDIYTDVSEYRGVFNQLLAKMDKHDKSSTWQWGVGIILAIALSVGTYFLGTMR
jgi:hypothetical protein